MVTWQSVTNEWTSLVRCDCSSQEQHPAIQTLFGPSRAWELTGGQTDRTPIQRKWHRMWHKASQSRSTEHVHMIPDSKLLWSIVLQHVLLSRKMLPLICHNKSQSVTDNVRRPLEHTRLRILLKDPAVDLNPQPSGSQPNILPTKLTVSKLLGMVWSSGWSFRMSQVHHWVFAFDPKPCLL